MFSKFFPKEAQKYGESEVFHSKSRVISYGPGVMLREEIFPAGTLLPRHEHYHEQISYIAYGKIKCTLADGSEMILSEGEAAYFGPNEPHTLEVLEDTSVIDAFTPIRIDHLEGAVFYGKK